MAIASFFQNTHPPSLKEHKHDPKRSLVYMNLPIFHPPVRRNQILKYFLSALEAGSLLTLQFQDCKDRKGAETGASLILMMERAKQKHWHFVMYCRNCRISHLTRCMTSKGPPVLSEILVLSLQIRCMCRPGGHRLCSLVSLQCKSSACQQQRLL